MEPAYLSFIREDEADSQVIGAIAYRPQEKFKHSPLLQDGQLLVIVVCQAPFEERVSVEHYYSHSTQYQILYVTLTQIKQWIITGQQQELMYYFLKGEIIWDIEGELSSFYKQVVTLEQEWQESRKLKEFSRLAHFYVQAKLGEEHQVLMDTYYNLIHALKHFAAIELIEMSGELPSVHVWDQLSGMNSTACKLFEELINSTETLEQRIQLALLAIEFSVTSKMAECSQPLLKVLSQKRAGWTMEQLTALEQLQYIKEDLPVLINLLIQRSIIVQEPVNTKGSVSSEYIMKFKVK